VTCRIHFTTQDLARTRIAEAPIPLMELSCAARVLQGHSQPALLDAWRHRVFPRLPPQARMALSLIPPVGWSPTFLSPAQAGTFQEVLDQVRASPHAQIHAQLAAIAEHQPIPSWTHSLTDDPAARTHLYDGLTHLCTHLLGPYWTQITSCFTADRSLRMRQVVTGGIGHLLAQANPQWLRWTPDVLEVRMTNGTDYDLHLAGQGILLVPSVFCTRSLVDSDAQPQPTVTYPAGLHHPLGRLTALAPQHLAQGSSAAITALLGHTRATVLNTIAEHPGCSTTELAILTGIAPSSASEHATILRQAGLICTFRHRNTALHSPTDLGCALLNGVPPPQPPPADANRTTATPAGPQGVRTIDTTRWD
jgi:DNA-binding MarR family transcriptional regulator